jgi:GR25 family glycosyltransferase involved in LPS biosynthesis
MNIVFFFAAAAPTSVANSFGRQDEVCLLQLKEKGRESWKGWLGKYRTNNLQDAAVGMSVCGRDDGTHCRLRKDGEAVLLEEYKRIDGAHSIVDTKDYPCYGFGRRDEARTFRDPVFPKTGGAWPHLYRGRSKIPELQNARVYVVSLPEAEKRRHHFAGEWAALDLDIPAVWVEAVNGRDYSSRTPFQREYLNRLSLADQRTHEGQPACWESHAGILSAVDGATAVIVEDDVAFVANFTARLKEFVGSLPPDWDMLHIGGDTFWDPPFAEKPQSWVKTRSASRTWGYIVRDRAVPKLLHANQVTKDLRAIDTFYGGLSFACDDDVAMNTYAPTQPLLRGVGSVSATDQFHPHTDAATKSLLAKETLEDEAPTYSWYPSTSCSLPKIHAASFDSWCCRESQQRC